MPSKVPSCLTSWFLWTGLSYPSFKENQTLKGRVSCKRVPHFSLYGALLKNVNLSSCITFYIWHKLPKIVNSHIWRPCMEKLTPSGGKDVTWQWQGKTPPSGKLGIWRLPHKCRSTSSHLKTTVNIRTVQLRALHVLLNVPLTTCLRKSVG